MKLSFRKLGKGVATSLRKAASLNAKLKHQAAPQPQANNNNPLRNGLTMNTTHTANSHESDEEEIVFSRYQQDQDHDDEDSENLVMMNDDTQRFRNHDFLQEPCAPHHGKIFASNYYLHPNYNHQQDHPQPFFDDYEYFDDDIEDDDTWNENSPMILLHASVCSSDSSSSSSMFSSNKDRRDDRQGVPLQKDKEETLVTEPAEHSLRDCGHDRMSKRSPPDAQDTMFHHVVAQEVAEKKECIHYHPNLEVQTTMEPSLEVALWEAIEAVVGEGEDEEEEDKDHESNYDALTAEEVMKDLMRDDPLLSSSSASGTTPTPKGNAFLHIYDHQPLSTVQEEFPASCRSQRPKISLYTKAKNAKSPAWSRREGKSSHTVVAAAAAEREASLPSSYEDEDRRRQGRGSQRSGRSLFFDNDHSARSRSLRGFFSPRFGFSTRKTAPPTPTETSHSQRSSRSAGVGTNHSRRRTGTSKNSAGSLRTSSVPGHFSYHRRSIPPVVEKSLLDDDEETLSIIDA